MFEIYTRNVLVGLTFFRERGGEERGGEERVGTKGVGRGWVERGG